VQQPSIKISKVEQKEGYRLRDIDLVQSFKMQHHLKNSFMKTFNYANGTKQPEDRAKTTDKYCINKQNTYR
jgi:hypothetical protein